LEEKPSAMDIYLENVGGLSLTDTLIFDNNSAALGGMLTSNNVYYNGHWGVLANDSVRPKIYAPSTFAIGSSITHLDESTYPVSSGNSLMTPTSARGEVEHSPGHIVLGVFADMGWQVTYPVGIEEVLANSVSNVQVFPNPFADEVTIEYFLRKSENVTVEIFNVLGKRIAVLLDEFQNEGGHFVKWNGIDCGGKLQEIGVYIYRVLAGTQHFSGLLERLAK
jgi:hypothetical protein